MLTGMGVSASMPWEMGFIAIHVPAK